MRLKMFIWHNPKTELPEKVYEFPMCCASETEIREHGGKNMYSSEPMQKPILFILPNYLTEIPNQRHTVPQEQVHQSIARNQQAGQQTDL